MPGNARLPCVSLKHLNHNTYPTFGISSKIVPSLESLPICTLRLFPRPMTWFASIRHQKIARVLLVTAPTWVFISKDLGTRLVHQFLVPMTSFTGIPCATTTIGPAATLANIFYLINVGPTHSPSSCVLFFSVHPSSEIPDQYSLNSSRLLFHLNLYHEPFSPIIQ